MSDPRRVLRRIVGEGDTVSYRVVEITPEQQRAEELRGARFFELDDDGEQVAQASREEDVQRTIGQTASPTETVISSLLSSAFAGAGRIGLSDEARQTIESREAGSPLASLGASLTGGVLGIPGLGAATPLGRLVAGRVAGGLGRGGQRAVAGLAEGVFGGAAVGIEQANINDEDISEHLLSNMALGGLFGLGAEGVIGGFGSIFRAGGRAAGGVADRVSNLGPFSRARQSLSRVVSGVDTQNLGGETLESLLQRSQRIHDIGGTRVFNQEVAEDLIGRVRVADDVAGSLEAARFLDEDAISGGLRGRVDEVARGAAAEEIGTIRNALDGLVTEGASTGLRSRAVRALDSLGNGLGAESQAELVARVFDARQALTQIAQEAPEQSSLRAALVGVGGGDGAGLGAVGQLDQLTEGLFGDVGSRITQRGRVLDDLLKRRAELNAFLGDVGGTTTITSSKVEAALKQAADRGDTQGLETITNFLDAQAKAEDFLGSIRGQAPGTETRDTIARMQSRADEFAAFRQVEQAKAAENQASGLGAVLGIGGGGLAGGIVGGALGGIPGAIIGTGTSLLAASISRPVVFEAGLFRLRQLVGRNAGRAERSLRRFNASVASNDRVPKSTLTVPKGGVAAVLYSSNKKERQEEYEQLANRVEELMANPDQFASLLGDGATDLHLLSPGLVPHLAQGAHRAASILAGHLPPSRLNRLNRIAMQSTEIPPSQSEVDGFLEVAAVIEDPFFGVDLMNSGRLSPNAAGALRDMYPRLHAEMAAAMGASVAQRRQRGQSVNYQALLRFSNFAGVPMDATLEPDFLLAMQDQSAQTAAQEGAQFAQPVSTRRPSALIDSAMSMTQSLESDR